MKILLFADYGPNYIHPLLKDVYKTDEKFIFSDKNLNDLNIEIKNGKLVILEGIYGDLTGDREINIKDAYIARLIAAKLIEPTEKQILFGDVDGDGKITAMDANILRKFAVNIIKQLPVAS